ncbi:MAG: glycosyltransferase family 2 protein [Muribaculaceae bacterium]|nr:glycosyltransferase family 2 protein [Muribaculaceae bacterium]
MKQTAIIILNWNGERLLPEFLPQVLANTDTTLADIIVADNGSTDSSLRLLEKKFPEVRVLPLGENFGFAEGYNRAIQLAGDYRYVVLLNSDVAPAAGWNRILEQFMDSHADVAAVQPKILSYKEKNKFEYAGAAGGYIDRHGYPYCRGRIFSVVETDRGQYDTPAEIFWASGAALMVRRRLYLDAGGLDPQFFAHMEEIDLCWRLQLAGYRIMAVPEAGVYHLGGASLDYTDPRKTYLNFRNSLLMMHKNLPRSVRRRKLIVRRLLDTLAWGKFMVSMDFSNASAIIRAHRDYARMSRSYNTSPATDLLARQPVDIVSAHYLHRKKTFKELR